MKRYIFAVLCICLLAFSAAAYADGYTVTYETNNCLAVVPIDETEYQYGQLVNVLFEPVQYTNGLIFYGWDWNNDGIADFGYNYNTFYMPNKNVTLKAICIAPYYPAPKPGPCGPAPDPCGPDCGPAPAPDPAPAPAPAPAEPPAPPAPPAPWYDPAWPVFYPVG